MITPQREAEMRERVEKADEIAMFTQMEALELAHHYETDIPDLLADRAVLVERLARFEKALNEIADYDDQPIWNDSRDDAADDMLEIAANALKTKQNTTKTLLEKGQQ